MNAPFRWAGGRRGGSRQGSRDCRRSRAGVVGFAGGSLGASAKTCTSHCGSSASWPRLRAAAVSACSRLGLSISLIQSWSGWAWRISRRPACHASSGLECRDGTDSIANIHGEIAARLQPLGFAAERRPFSAHLTIGRVKSARAGVSARDIRQQWSGVPAEAGECRIQAVTLFRSRLSPRGAAYSRWCDYHCSDT